MPRILITNDDGIEADGLRILADRLADLGDITVVAPAEESSAVSHALTLRRPLRLTHVRGTWYSVDGTPTDCVHLGCSDVLGQVPDLVVSGINNGLNVGDDVTYSGTVAGALEGVLFGAPALAVSLQRDATSYAHAADIARQLSASVLSHGLPPRTLLNVNVPAVPRGRLRVTVQGKRRQRIDPGRPQHGSAPSEIWIGPANLEWEQHPESDYEAIRNGLVSVTPLHTDWTNHTVLSAVEALAGECLAGVE
jgi:5'-nucleotidase